MSFEPRSQRRRRDHVGSASGVTSENEERKMAVFTIGSDDVASEADSDDESLGYNENDDDDDDDRKRELKALKSEEMKSAVLSGAIPRRALDRLLMQIGVCGFYPLGILMLLYYLNAIAKMYIPLATFTAWLPHHCCPVGGSLQEVLSDTMTEDGAKLLNVEQTADWNYNHRLHKKDPPNNRVSNETKTQLADNVCANLVADYGWNYATNVSFSVVSDWDLGCQKKSHAVQMSNAFFMGGLALGGLVHGVLADTFGRKPVMLTSSWSLAIFGLVSVTVPDMDAFIGMRFIQGFFEGGILLTTSTMICELFPSEMRAIPHMMCQFCNVVGFSLLDLLAYLERRWKFLLLVLPIFFVVTTSYVFLVPETLEFLFHTGQTRRACQQLQQVMDSRGIDLDVYEELFFHVSNVTNGISSLTNLSSKDARNKDSLRERTDDDGEAPIEASQDDELVNASPNDSVDTPLNTSGAASAAASATASPQWCHLQAVAVVSLSILTGINYFIYYGLVFSTDEFSGDRFMNFWLFSLADLAGGCVAISVIKYLPRRVIILLNYICIIICATVLILVENLVEREDRPENFHAMLLVSHLFIKINILSALSVMELCSMEIPPTSIRSKANGICFAFKGLAGISASYVSWLLRHYDTYAEVAFLTLTVLAVILIWCLPEMKDQPIPRHSADLHECYKQTKYKWACFDKE